MKKMISGKQVGAAVLAAALVLGGLSLPARAETDGSAEPLQEHTFTVTLPADRTGYDIVTIDPVAKTETVLADDATQALALRHEDYSFRIAAEEDYQAGSKVSVYVNRAELLPDDIGHSDTSR